MVRRMNPWALGYIIQEATIVFLAFMMWKGSRARIRLIRDMGRLHAMADGAIMFANALAERNIAIPCDDCGNVMGPSEHITVTTRPDGSTYIGHHSHNRHVDWGNREPSQ